MLNFMSSSSRLGLAGIAFALLAATPPRARIQDDGAKAPAKGAPAPAKETPKAQVDPAFTKLNEEYLVASRLWQVEMAKARDAKLPAASYPPNPARAFWTRFEKLADAGVPQALRWCIDSVDDLDLAANEQNDLRLGLYRQLIEKCADHDLTRDTLRGLVTEASPKRLGIDVAAELCADAARRTTRDDLRAIALFNQAQVYATGKDEPRHVARAKELYAEVQTRYPDKDVAKRAAGKLFQLEKLQIGMVCPDFTAKDVDEIEFKLSDYRGKVVVLDFWGFW